jgi:hypothetical protein
MTCCKHKTPPLHSGHAGERATMAVIDALPDLYKHQSAIRLLHDQIDFTTTSARGPIIAMY